jgi:Na+-translocating ferredoxin:NAD+ oxidoreductase subunit B
VRDGRGRAITQEEALDIVKHAKDAGLVLQPSNSKTASFICCCCGCCCGVLRNLKLQSNPAELIVSAYVATLDREECIGCSLCLERCQMDALRMTGDRITLDANRCIGCGLCVTTCPTGALTLSRKPAPDQPRIPRTMAHTMLQLAYKRGKLTPGSLVEMVAKSQWDRLRGRRTR